MLNYIVLYYIFYLMVLIHLDENHKSKMDLDVVNF